MGGTARQFVLRWTLLLAPLLVIAGCGTEPVREPSAPAGPVVAQQDGFPALKDIPPNLAETPNAVPKPEPRSRYGNPSQYSVLGKTYKVRDTSAGFTQVGHASWYGTKFQGKRTSSGQPYDMFKMTAAHKTLPIPSYVRVTNLSNHKSVIVLINDRGPFHSKRIVDLSYVAALKLGLLKHGTAEVKLQAITPLHPTMPTVPPELADSGLQKVALRDTSRASSDHRFLQVGVFLDRDNAEIMRDRLQGRGVDLIRLVAGEYGDQPATRVLVGPLDDQRQLQEMRARLGQHGIASVPASS